MNNKKINSFFNQFPEWYYDFIVYIASSLVFYFLLCYSNLFLRYEIDKLILQNSIIIQFYIFITILSVLYITGQLITFLSYWIIWSFPGFFLKHIVLWYRETRWYKKFAKIKFINESIANELNKRYARANIARNNCFISLLFIIIPTSISKIYFIVFFVLFFLEAHIRKKWLLEIVKVYYQEIKNKKI